MPVNNQLTNTFKGIIQKEDLIDTGALLRSAKVYVDINRDIIQVNLVSKYYVKYLNDRYNITKQFMNTDVFQNEVGNLLVELFNIKLVNIINTGKDTNFNPDVIILINGR
jgi:hypothetical protein